MKMSIKAIITLSFIGVMIFISAQNCQPAYTIKISEDGLNQIAGGNPGGPNPGCTVNCDPGSSPVPIPDFACKKIIPIKLTNVLDVPARDKDGICYSLKLLDAIAFADSSGQVDDEVISRNHDNGSDNPNDTRHPNILGKALVKFLMHDRRFIKLSGSGSELLPIRADNFIIVGTYPDRAETSADISYYRAYGTADSTVGNTNGVLFRNQPLALQSFGPAGTSTITPLDITNSVQPMVQFALDVRALDCGSKRELSDVYLMFQ